LTSKERWKKKDAINSPANSQWLFAVDSLGGGLGMDKRKFLSFNLVFFFLYDFRMPLFQSVFFGAESKEDYKKEASDYRTTQTKLCACPTWLREKEGHNSTKNQFPGKGLKTHCCRVLRSPQLEG
jgi:hypothetical protein